MKRKLIFLCSLVLLLTLLFIVVRNRQLSDNDDFISYIVDTKKQPIHFYWQDEQRKNFGSLANLKRWLAKDKMNLLFAMNAGMYKQDGSPQGLFIEKGITIKPLDTSSGEGNFYLKPNGVFYITKDDVSVICNSINFKDNGNIKYATQSGPMLVMDGQLHPTFKEGSTNIKIRNGVGILPDNKIVFAISKKPISFHDFANYFKSLGCKYALYLDGLVSQMYLPEKNWIQTDGNFGVIIGRSTKSN